jgi:hypothetical protein
MYWLRLCSFTVGAISGLTILSDAAQAQFIHQPCPPSVNPCPVDPCPRTQVQTYGYRSLAVAELQDSLHSWLTAVVQDSTKPAASEKLGDVQKKVTALIDEAIRISALRGGGSSYESAVGLAMNIKAGGKWPTTELVELYRLTTLANTPGGYGGGTPGDRPPSCPPELECEPGPLSSDCVQPSSRRPQFCVHPFALFRRH